MTHYAPETIFSFAVLGACIFSAAVWFLCAVVDLWRTRGAWYVECPDCGARVRLSRWKLVAWWRYHEYEFPATSWCYGTLRLVWRADDDV